jgi:hypothetical protein
MKYRGHPMIENNDIWGVLGKNRGLKNILDF